MKQKVLLVGQVNEPVEEYSNFGTFVAKFNLVSVEFLEDALTAIAENRTPEPIQAIIFARSVLVDNYSKDKGSLAAMLVINAAKKYYDNIKVISMIFDDTDTKGKSAAIIWSYIAEKSRWDLIYDFISPS